MNQSNNNLVLYWQELVPGELRGSTVAPDADDGLSFLADTFNSKIFAASYEICK